ncbi:Holliday junction resolvase RuvX [Capnocytophaga canimorsus]|uniref:Holliday junction resolvase RuvX n=1 Tax=Capnocytophaga canimorsus TaxID=28188 RepID=UPI001AD544DA|nr:Holliday junction resolvase RuvX [Capnocytophaga canimorsus]GIM58216.1 putative pre-16S rRNA nuclease [Capnocytophaga canimorsus]
MARILALDYGTRRTGIAVTDPLQLIASGLTTVSTPELLDFLKAYLAQESVCKIVIGKPKRLNNEDSETEIYITAFIEQLKKAFPELDLIRVDERFTSKMAFQSLIDGGLKKKQRQNKALIDQVSATLILQSYLEQKPL